MKSVDASVDVVLEKLTKSRPESGSAGGGAEHQIEDLGAHPLVDPLYHSEIIFNPAGIRGAWRSAEVDVSQKVAAAKVDLEKMAPMVVIVLG